MPRKKLGDSTAVAPSSTDDKFDLADQITRPKQIDRSTSRLSVSLLEEERTALEGLGGELRRKGHWDLKTSRLARVAFKMLLDADEQDVLRVASEVPNLEKLRGKR